MTPPLVEAKTRTKPAAVLSGMPCTDFPVSNDPVGGQDNRFNS